MIKGAIFDLDGTLTDSMWIWDTVAIDFMKQHGFPVPSGLREAVKPLSFLQMVAYYQHDLGIPLSAEEIMNGTNQLVEHRYFYEVPLKAHAGEFLQKLREAGVRCGVATASEKYMVEAALTRLGIRDYFEFVLTCTELGSGKDEPAIFEEALRRLGTAKDETVVFEDAVHAIRTATKAGFRVVALYDDSAAEDAEEIKEIADRYCRSFAECEVESL